MTEEKKKSNKKLYIGIGIFLFIMFAVNAFTGNLSPNDKQADEQPSTAKKEEKKEEPKENKKEEKKEPSYTKDQEDGLLEAYDSVIKESNGLIHKIESTDNYETVNVYVAPEFEALGKEERQRLINDWGSKIEGNTRARLFFTGIDEFIPVYFLNEKKEHVAKTSHYDRKWTVK